MPRCARVAFGFGLPSTTALNCRAGGVDSTGLRTRFGLACEALTSIERVHTNSWPPLAGWDRERGKATKRFHIPVVDSSRDGEPVIVVHDVRAHADVSTVAAWLPDGVRASRGPSLAVGVKDGDGSDQRDWWTDRQCESGPEDQFGRQEAK
jgi:hypothetical protein